MRVLENKDFIKNDIISASKKRLIKNTAPHGHDFFEIEFVISGSGICKIDGIEYDMCDNSVFVINPTHIHEIRDADAEIVNIMFNYDYEEFMDEMGTMILKQPQYYVANSEDGTFLRSIFLEIARVHETNSDYAMNLLRCIIYKLYQMCGETKQNETDTSYINKAIIYIHKNFATDIRLETIAAEVGLSETYFSDLFHKQTGIKFKGYLDNIRFSYAKKLLKYTTLSVKEIYFRSGFSDYANFSKRFKNRYGVAATKFRIANSAETKKLK